MLSATVHNINNLVSCFALLGESNALSAAAPLPLHYPQRRNLQLSPLSPTLCVSFSLPLSLSLSWSASPCQSRCSTLSLLLSVCDLIIVFAVRFLPVCLPVWLPELCCLLLQTPLPSFRLPLHTQLLLHSLYSFGCQACLDIRRAVELALALAPTFSFQNSFTFCCCPSCTAPLLSPLLLLFCYFYCRSSSTSLLVCVSIWRICFALLAFLFNVD